MLLAFIKQATASFVVLQSLNVTDSESVITGREYGHQVSVCFLFSFFLGGGVDSFVRLKVRSILEHSVRSAMLSSKKRTAIRSSVATTANRPGQSIFGLFSLGSQKMSRSLQKVITFWFQVHTGQGHAFLPDLFSMLDA